MTDCVLVWTTLGADADARTLAETLVNERLAACVTVQAPMDSVYRWRGSVEHERERQILIKTTTERVPALAARVRELHPYRSARVSRHASRLRKRGISSVAARIDDLRLTADSL